MNYAQRWTLAVALKNAPSETGGGASGDYGESDATAAPPTTYNKAQMWSVGTIVVIGGLLAGFIGGVVWSDA